MYVIICIVMIKNNRNEIREKAAKMHTIRNIEIKKKYEKKKLKQGFSVRKKIKNEITILVI